MLKAITNLLIFCALLCGCDSDHAPWDKLKIYLETRASGDVSDNAFDPSVYETMLSRLKLTKPGDYAYLWHQTEGRVVTLYWYGPDANVDYLLGVMEDGTEQRFDIPPDYRKANERYVISGEPQYYPIILDEGQGLIEFREFRVFGGELKGDAPPCFLCPILGFASCPITTIQAHHVRRSRVRELNKECAPNQPKHREHFRLWLRQCTGESGGPLVLPE